MKKYICGECGAELSKNQLDPYSFVEGDYYCKECASDLRQAGWDAVNPNHNFDSYEDWDKRGH